MSEFAKLIFADESKKLIFEDLQPKLIFADEFKKLIFDVEEIGDFLLVGVGEFLLIDTHNGKLRI